MYNTVDNYECKGVCIRMASNKSKLETPEYKARLLAFSERLKKERDKLGITQGELAKRAELSSHAVISRWEAVANPTRDDNYLSAGAVARELPDVNDMLKLCDVFDCEIAYLVGKQEKPTKPLTDICRHTGLSEDAVKMLHFTHTVMTSWPFSDVINALISQESEDGEYSAFERMCEYLTLNPADETIRASLGSNRYYEIGKEDFMSVLLLDINRKLQDLRKQVQEELRAHPPAPKKEEPDSTPLFEALAEAVKTGALRGDEGWKWARKFVVEDEGAAPSA